MILVRCASSVAIATWQPDRVAKIQRGARPSFLWPSLPDTFPVDGILSTLAIFFETPHGMGRAGVPQH